MHKALENSFSDYENSSLATTGHGPISEFDKQTLKYNLRKQDLFEQALFFSQNLFNMKSPKDLTSEQLMDFTSSILSIVLSHHY